MYFVAICVSEIFFDIRVAEIFLGIRGLLKYFFQMGDAGSATYSPRYAYEVILFCHLHHHNHSKNCDDHYNEIKIMLTIISTYMHVHI